MASIHKMCFVGSSCWLILILSNLICSGLSVNLLLMDITKEDRDWSISIVSLGKENKEHQADALLLKGIRNVDEMHNSAKIGLETTYFVNGKAQTATKHELLIKPKDNIYFQCHGNYASIYHFKEGDSDKISFTNGLVFSNGEFMTEIEAGRVKFGEIAGVFSKLAGKGRKRVQPYIKLWDWSPHIHKELTSWSSRPHLSADPTVVLVHVRVDGETSQLTLREGGYLKWKEKKGDEWSTYKIAKIKTNKVSHRKSGTGHISYESKIMLSGVVCQERILVKGSYNLKNEARYFSIQNIEDGVRNGRLGAVKDHHVYEVLPGYCDGGGLWYWHKEWDACWLDRYNAFKDKGCNKQ